MTSHTLHLETTGIGTTAPIAANDPAIQPAALREAVAKLADLRRACAIARAAHEVAFAEWLNENATIETRYEEARAAVALAEVELRIRAVQRFKITSDKTPAPGLEVKEFDVLEMDQATVEAKARERGIAIVVDQDALEKIIKADVRAWPTARVTKEPKATIARDLDKALAVADAMSGPDLSSICFPEGSDALRGLTPDDYVVIEGVARLTTAGAKRLAQLLEREVGSKGAP